MVMELQNSTLGIFGMAGFAHQQPQATPLINSGVKRVGACVSFCISTHDIIYFLWQAKKNTMGTLVSQEHFQVHLLAHTLISKTKSRTNAKLSDACNETRVDPATRQPHRDGCTCSISFKRWFRAARQRGRGCTQPRGTSLGDVPGTCGNATARGAKRKGR